MYSVTHHGILLIFLFILSASAFAEEASQATLDETTTAEQIDIPAKQQALESLKEKKAAHLRELNPETIDETMLSTARLEVEAAQAELEAFQVETENLRKQLTENQQELGHLQQELDLAKPANKPENSLLSDSPSTSTQQLPNNPETNKRQEIEAKQQTVTNLKAQSEIYTALVDLAQQRLKILEDWYQTLLSRKRDYLSKNTEEAWQVESQVLKEKRQTLLDEVEALKKQLAGLGNDASGAQSQQIQLDIFLGEQHAWLLQLEAYAYPVRTQMERLVRGIQSNDLSADKLLRYLEEAKTLSSQALAIIDLLKSKRALIDRFKRSLNALETGEKYTAEQHKNNLAQLKALGTEMEKINDRAVHYIAIINNLTTILDQEYQSTWNKELTDIHSLPQNFEEWQLVKNDLYTTLPQELGKKLQVLITDLKNTSSTRGYRSVVLVAAWLISLTVVFVLLRIHLTSLKNSRYGFSWRSLLTFGHLIKRDLLIVALLGSGTIIVTVNHIPFTSYKLFFSISIAALIVTLLMTLNKLLHRQAKNGLEWYNQKLYNGMRLSLWIGAFFSTGALLFHQLPVNEVTLNTFDRSLMLALLSLSIAVLWWRRSALEIFRKMPPRRYIFIYLLILMIPVFGLVTATIGFIGYVNLAREMAKFGGLFMLAFTIWIILRTYLGDLFRWISNYIITNIKNGWIWSRAIIQPMHFIFRVILLFSAIYLLLTAWGLADNLKGWTDEELFSIAGKPITLNKSIIAIALVVIFLWAARWSRELAYRWFFQRVADRGARNSLSVFTQYLVFIIGVFTLLKAIGVDLTALTVLAGAIGVGIGFGMQTIANNFISGVLLLIERPMRTGDVVNIGNSEGEVTRIGMRSITVKNWDNTEVIIPNTDTITSPFTNWTHNDCVVRTMFHVGVSYNDDPHKVKEILLEILEKHTAILRNPPMNVFLSDFGDSSVDFRVQYFINMDQSDRLKVKSEVLFGIWDAFKKQGIEIPYPRRDLQIRGNSALPSILTGNDAPVIES